MKLAIHLASAYFARAGHPAPGHEAGAADHARGAVLADVDRLAREAEADVVLVAIPHPAKGRPFRSALAQGWRREQDEGGKTERAAVLWAGLERTAEALASAGARIVAPAPWPQGHLLPLGGDELLSAGGLVASSRDVVATLARQHREVADGSELRIVTTRPSVAALLLPEHSISVAVLVDGAWAVMTKPAELAAWRGWHPRPSKTDGPLPVDRVPRALLADYEALTMIHRVGPETAIKLLRAGRWRPAIEALRSAEETHASKRSEVQRRLVELGARGLRELLAVAGLRDDVPIEGAALAPRRSDDDHGDAEREGDRRGHQPVARAEEAHPRDGRHDGAPHAGGREGAYEHDDQHARGGAEPVAPPALDDPTGLLPTDPAAGRGPAPVPQPTAPSPPAERDIKPETVKETPMTQPTDTYIHIEQPYEEPRAAAPLAVREPEAAAVEPQRPREMTRPRPEAPPAPRQAGPRTSDTTGALFAALAAAQTAFGEVVKSRNADVKNRAGQYLYSYKYANLSDVMRAIDKPLRENGLVPMQIPMGDRVYVRLVHGPSGEWIEGGLPLALPDYGSDIQRLGSALTYMRRYLLTMMLGIVADDEDDDDGAAAQGARR